MKFSIGIIALVATVIVFLPKPAVLADPYFIQPYKVETDPDVWWTGAYQTDFEPLKVNFKISVMGDFSGRDRTSIDCDGDGTYDVITNGTAMLQRVGVHDYWVTFAEPARCTYLAGTYRPHIYVVRTGSSDSGCGHYAGSYLWYCWQDYSGVTATTDYTLDPFYVFPRQYSVNIWPNRQSPYVGKAPQNVSFVAQVTWPQVYNNSISGSFTYHIDCGDGTPVKDVSGRTSSEPMSVNNLYYDANYRPLGGAGVNVYAGFNTGSVCNYTKPGVYRATISVDGTGAPSTPQGAAYITLFPSSGLSARATATPTSGDAPLNDVAIHATANGIMPARGAWGPVRLSVSCDSNGVTNDSYHINFNTAGTPMDSTLSHDLKCSYPTAGTHTATVTVEQNNLTASGNVKIYVIGQLKCDGTDKLPAPANFRLDWQVQNVDRCEAGGNSLTTSLWNWAAGVLAPSETKIGSRTFYNVKTRGEYLFKVTCYKSGYEPVVQSCPLNIY